MCAHPQIASQLLNGGGAEKSLQFLVLIPLVARGLGPKQEGLGHVLKPIVFFASETCPNPPQQETVP